MVERLGGAPIANAAAAAGGRVGTARGNGGGFPPHPADEDVVDDGGVFPHYSARAAAGRRDGGGGGGGGGGGRSGGGPQEWSRQQRHAQQQELHPARGRAGSASDGQVAAPSRPPMPGAGATPAAASVAEQFGGVGDGRGPGRSRGVADAVDYYDHDHPYYRRDREPRGGGGPAMGGRGRHPYNDVGPPMGAQGSPAAVPAAHHPYPGPPRADHDHHRAGSGAGGRGGGGRPRSPVQMAARGSPRSSGHPMRPPDRGGEAVLPPRYVRASPPSINQTLCEAIERVFEHREKMAGAGVGVGGRVASAAVTEGSNTSTGLRGDAEMNGGRRGAAPPPRGVSSSLALDAKKATLRIIAIMESFEGRLNDVMRDARARAELDAIFPGMHEREFRALLEECIERSQLERWGRKRTCCGSQDPCPEVPPAKERVTVAASCAAQDTYGRMEAERMYLERERAYRRDHPGHPHEPPPPPIYQEMRDREERFYASPRRPYPHPDVAYHDEGYLRRRPGAVGAYHEQRPPVAAARGGGGGFVHANRALGPEDSSHKYHDAELEAPSYPQYAAAAGRGRGVPPEEAAAAAAAAAAAGMAGPPPLYKPPVRRGPGVGLSQPSEGGAYHRHGHHPRGGGSGGGGSHHSSAPTDDSPPGHDRRRVGASPPGAQSLRGDTRPRGGSVASLPPSTSRPRVVTNGTGGDGRLEDDGTSSTTSRPDDPKQRSSEERGDGGGGGGRHPAASGGARPRVDSLAGEDCDVGKPFCEVVRDASGLTRLFIPETPPVVPRRPPSKGNKRETLGDIAHRIPVTVMRPYFNYPLRTAAEAMNISVTTLKRLCRRHGVKRWPHRQISGINRAMAHLEFQQDQAGRRNSEKITTRNNQVSEQMQELLRRRKVMIEHAFESDDGGSRQQWKSSDSEDEDGGGGGAGGGDPESFSDANPDHHHSFAPKRRAIKDTAAISNGNAWGR
ncbi:Putative NIN-like transcription factor [Ectocarpus siliculosus]|uniref:NIN-like transcription factor n=1 Tax=Ectocarpus siliculosus TaxID=2880 RepID=D8LNV2_ECTSI|nr:Putative NIN-like transcription factor [Ectocarpus siliculosus]|eukprot:CBN78312.1 Putative NIN-like transcription factor [Ectocarpus siliculosus]